MFLLVSDSSFVCEEDDKNSSTKFDEDFIKKMEEWEKIKRNCSLKYLNEAKV